MANTDKEYKGRKMHMDFDCKLGNDGWWTVNVDVTQLRSKDFEVWEEATASVKTLDRDLDKAIGQASMSLFYYGDLFQDKELEAKEKLQ